jgi:hypothetical protein
LLSTALDLPIRARPVTRSRHSAFRGRCTGRCTGRRRIKCTARRRTRLSRGHRI